MKRRRLSAEDQELWDLVASRTERIRKPGFEPKQFDPDVGMPSPDTRSIRKAKSVLLGKPQGRARPPGHDLMPALPDRLQNAPVQMDQKSFGKLKRGKLRPEGRLDLHGMTLERAHPTLTGFIMSAHAQGKRLVLVITGKGKQRDEGGPIPVRHGVLRHQVPQWLKLAPLGPLVLEVTPAHVRHGGEGAFSVYLRRSR